MLEARALSKYYGHQLAVHGVSFTIGPGEILGCLGANGAGKSTTVKMLTGLIEPSEGQIFYHGRTVHDDFTAFQRRIGYVPEEAHLYPHLTGREYLQLAGRLRGLPAKVLEPRMDELLDAFALWTDRHAPLSSYSKGMRQKILLSAALLHDPDILILDEPFSGLDVRAALVLRTLLRELAGRGKIILYSSHVLEVVEKVCTDVLILRKGEVAAYDSIHRLRTLMSQPSLEGVFSQLADVRDTEEVTQRILGAITLTNGGSSEPPKRRLTSAARVHAAQWMGDIRHAFRSLTGSPGFSAAAIFSLSLGICIATCALSEMNGMALRTIPGVFRPNELAALELPASYPAYRRYRQQDKIFSSTFAYLAPVPFAVSAGSRKERVWGQLVTPSYFSTLGVRPELGQFFGKRHEQSGAAPEAVVSHAFWRERMGSDPSAIGRRIRVNSKPVTIIGVGPEDFFGASPLIFRADLWMPISVEPDITPELAGNPMERRDRAMFRVAGRLRPGVSRSSAEAGLDAVAQQMEQDYGDPERMQGRRRVRLVEGGKLLPLRQQDVPFFTSFLSVVAGLIMLIATANAGSMMLARAMRRHKEIAIRIAMGAGRARIVRQSLAEGMMIAFCAAAPAFLGCTWLMRLLSQVRMPLLIPVAFHFEPDGTVLALTIALTFCTGLIFGLVPALRATSSDLTPALKEGGNIPIRRNRAFSIRNALMICQLAGSLALLVMLGILSLGIQTTLGVQAGFDPKNLYLVSLDPVRDGYSGAQSEEFLRKLLDRVKTLPIVKAAALTETVPASLPGRSVRGTVVVHGSKQTVSAARHTVGRDYFATAGIPILRGRGFGREDEKTAGAVVVSAAFAARFWKGDDPVSRRIEIRDGDAVPAKILPGTYDYRAGASSEEPQTLEVVGVAGDVAEGLIAGAPRPAVYMPLGSADYAQPAVQGLTLLIRAAPGSGVTDAIRREIAAMDDNVTVFNARSMPDQIDQFIAPMRIASWTYALVGVFGLILSSVGLAGMTAYSVANRTREIGIRMALGAQRYQVMAAVMKEGTLLVTSGTLAGMAAAWAGSRMLSAMNAGVGQVTATSTSDPVVLIGAPVLLAALALAACYLPARRSTRIDPVAALRRE